MHLFSATSTVPKLSAPQHTWVEGQLLHHLLTGDDIVYESLRKTRSWLLQKRFFDTYDFTNAREAGWHLIHLCMLAASQDDPDCFNAASIIVERVLERAEPDGGWVRNLTESHCGCGYPRCRGEAGFMVGVLLSGLKRYYHLTQDPKVSEAIIGGALAYPGDLRSRERALPLYILPEPNAWRQFPLHAMGAGRPDSRLGTLGRCPIRPLCKEGPAHHFVWDWVDVLMYAEAPMRLHVSHARSEIKSTCSGDTWGA